MNILYLDDFRKTIPKTPMAADNFDSGVFHHPRWKALKMRYLSLNPPGVERYVSFDVDREGAGAAWIDADLPEPTFIVINRDNGHAHLTYRLSSPICTADNGIEKPKLYLKDIESAYIFKMEADAAYNGVLTKNPIHNSWTCIACEGSLAKAYTLDDLARGIDLGGHRKTKAKLREVIAGRNCSLFESLRVWAYKAVSEYWRPEGKDSWEAAVLAEAEVMAAGYLIADPSFTKDVRETSRSVARWTWEHHTPQKRGELIKWTHRTERQRERITERWSVESKKAAGLELLKAGASREEVIRGLLVSEATVKRWKKELTVTVAAAATLTL
jgi:hypothetical protein